MKTFQAVRLLAVTLAVQPFAVTVASANAQGGEAPVTQAAAGPVDPAAAALFIAGSPIPATFSPADVSAAAAVASAREAQLTDNGETAEDYRERVADAAEALRLSPTDTARAVRVYSTASTPASCRPSPWPTRRAARSTSPAARRAWPPPCTA